MDISTLTSVACSVGVVLTMAPLSQGNGEDVSKMMATLSPSNTVMA